MRCMAPSRRGWGTLRTLRSGRIHASYVSPIDGLRHNAPGTYDRKMDAEAWLAAEHRLLDLGVWTPPAERVRQKTVSAVTVEEYMTKWLEERDLSPGTRELYRIHAEKRIYPRLGSKPVSGLSAACVRTFWAGMGTKYPTARRHAYSLLRACMSTAVEDGLISENPCRVEIKPEPERDVEALTPEELDSVAAEVNEHYRVAVYILAWTSVRFGELIELRRKDVEDKDGVMKLRVRRGAARVGREIVVGKTKTVRSNRPVTVPPHVAEMIRTHMELRVDSSSQAFLVTTTKGDRLSKSAFTRSLKKGYAEIGRTDLRVHDLRAVGATFAAQAGATTKELMARLGHTTPRMAMKYQMASEARDEAIAKAMSDLL